MAAAVKYRLEAYSFRYADVYRVDILEEGYTGEIIPKNIGAGHIRLSKADGIIQNTTLGISIQADVDFEYKQFFQYDNLKYPVKLYKNDVQIWSGHIVNESYSENYINPPYDVELVAIDGLGFLENFTFDNPIVQPYIYALNYCLEKTGLSLGFDFGVDLYESRMSTDYAMMAQVSFNGAIFTGDKCSDVIERLLPFGCTITQHNNRWLIRRPFEDAEKDHQHYDNIGDIFGVADVIPGETLLIMGDVATGEVYPVGTPVESLEHAWRSATIKKEYSKKESFFNNFNFADGVGNWIDHTDGISYIVNNGDYYYAMIPGFVGIGTEKWIEQSIEVVASDSNFIFEIKYTSFAWGQNPTSLLYGPLHPIVQMQVQLGVYYLTTAGWGTAPAFMQFQPDSSVGAPEWSSLKIITATLPASGDLIIRLYQIQNLPIAAKYRAINGVGFKDVKAYSTDLIEYPTTINYTVPIKENAADSNQVVVLKPTDLPVLPNAHLYLENGTFLAGAIPTETWSNNGLPADVIENVIANQLASYYGTTRQKLSGCNWRGADLHLNAICKHPKNSNVKFVATDGTWYILEDEFNINWLEIAGSSTSLATVESVASNGSVRTSSTLVSSGNIIIQPNRLISGGIVTWLYDLTFAVSAANYVINNQYYNTVDTIVTLDDADITNPRIDVIAVNISEEVVVITGVPAASPQKPSVNPAEELELTFILVPPGATEPIDILTEVVYDENIEWTGTPNWLNITLNGTIAPFAGSKCIDAGETEAFNQISFSNATLYDEADFSSLSFWLKFKANDVAGFSLFVLLKNSTTVVSVLVPATFDMFFTEWQNVAIPISAFNLNGSEFNTVVFYWYKADTATFSGFYMDLIRFQTGVPLPNTGDTYVTAVEWNAEDETLIVKRNNNQPNIETLIPLPVQLQSDWTQADTDAKDYIKNKPAIPAAQIQSDWTQADSGALDYIKNKPTIPPLIITKQVTGLTLVVGSWSADGGLFKYVLSDANITATSSVEVIPANASYDVLVEAEPMPETESASGSVSMWVKTVPSADIPVTINITLVI